MKPCTLRKKNSFRNLRKYSFNFSKFELKNELQFPNKINKKNRKN